MTPSIFVSYRRESDRRSVMPIVEKIRNALGPESVFVDQDMSGGVEWEQAIEAALAASYVVLVLIGPGWLAAQDEHHRRRIDLPDDWVRREIEYALKDKQVIPVLLEGAQMPKIEALPETLGELTSRQFMRVRADSLAADLESLQQALVLAARGEAERKYIFPAGFAVKPTPLTEGQLEAALRELSRWRLDEPNIEDDDRLPPGSKGQEIVRYFRFKSFLDAVEFMHKTAPHIDAMDHHPKWENVYWNLRVRLSTWDIKHRLSDRDVVLARYLERQFEAFSGS